MMNPLNCITAVNSTHYSSDVTLVMSSDTTMGGVVKTKFTPKLGVQRQRKTLPVVTSSASTTTPAPQRASAHQMSPKKDGARVSFAPHVAYKPPPSTSTSSTSATSRSSHGKPRVPSAVEVVNVSNNKIGNSDGGPDEQQDELRDEQDEAAAVARYAPITLPFTTASIDARVSDDQLILFQLPTALPLSLPSSPPSSSASLSAEALSRLPSGHIGTLRRHVSGRQTLTIGEVVYDVTSAVDCSNDQSVIHVDTAAATFAHVGAVIARANISIDVDQWKTRNVIDKHARADELVNKQHNQKIKQER